MATSLIRPGKEGDCEALSRLYRRSVMALGPRDYGPAQVEAWASLAPSPARLRDLAGDGRTRLVAADGADRPLAFADLTAEGLIHFLYAAPEAAGSGAVSALYDALEEAARRAGLEQVQAEASEAARRFFLKKGFQVTARRDFAVAGVPIHNYAMIKSLLG